MTRSHLQIQMIADVASGSETFSLATLNAAVPSEALKEFELGRKKLLDDKEVDAGIAHLEKAIAFYPRFVAAYILMGAARMESKQWEKAEGALRHALEIDRKASEALFTLGEAYQRQQKYNEAERAFQDGLKLDPKSPHGHFGPAGSTSPEAICPRLVPRSVKRFNSSRISLRLICSPATSSCDRAMRPAHFKCSRSI